MSNENDLEFAKELPEVVALVKVTYELLDMVKWMSGAPAFGPEGEAYNGWLKNYHNIKDARMALIPFGYEEPSCLVENQDS